MLIRDVVLQEWTADEYFADERVSRSDLVEVAESPALYHGRRIAKTIPTRPPTPSMVFGTAVHMALFEPAEAERLIHEERRFSTRKADQEAKKRWLEQLPPGSLLLDADEFARLRAVVGAIRRHRTAASILLGEGLTEASITWDEGEHGCRARLDKVLVRGTRALVADLKTTANPSPEAFAKSAINYGYHLQAAWYPRPIPALLGVERADFVFVVVRNAPPFEVAVYAPDKDFIALGERRVREALDLIKQCRERGDWSPAWQTTTNTLRPPRWALSQEAT